MKNKLLPNSVTWFCFCLLLSACASVPDFPDDGDFGEFENRMIESGVEILAGRSENGTIAWMAVRSKSGIRVSSPVTDDKTILSRHPGAYFSEPGVFAAITGSPHGPIRFRSGLPQQPAGFYRTDNDIHSPPDGLHDALGLDSNRLPLLLTPEMQQDWAGNAVGGFYTILEDSIPVSPVPVRDAVSAVGWSADRTSVIFLVIRGREGEGYSYNEAGLLLKALGADCGIAMDGGGSARLTWREQSGIYSFPAGRFYRAVPNHLLIVAGGD